MQLFYPPAKFATPVRCITDVARLTCGLVESAEGHEVAAVHLGHREELLSVVIYDDHEPRSRPDCWRVVQQAAVCSAVSFWLVGLGERSVLAQVRHAQWCADLQALADRTRFEGWLQLGRGSAASSVMTGLVNE